MLLLGCSGCSPIDDRLWPPIRPESSPSAPAALGSPFLRPLPENIWELAGALSLLLGVSAAGFVYWRFPGLRDEFSSLRAQTRLLHDRRDRNVVDLAQMARNLRDLEQEITVLRKELARRAEAPAHSPQALSTAVPSAPSPAAVVALPAPAASSLEPPSAQPPSPEVPLLHPPARPGRGRNRVVVATADSAESWRPVEPARETPAPSQVAPLPAHPPMTAESSPLAAQVEATALHGARNLLHPRPDSALEFASPPIPVDPRPEEPVGLEALIIAINSRGRSPISGITCVELDIAPAPESGTGLEPIATRLRMVSRDGRFLLVMVDGDAWLFPTIDTLDQFDQRQPAEGIFLAYPEAIERPHLLVPAMLREVGGLWEVTDPGKILVPRG